MVAPMRGRIHPSQPKRKSWICLQGLLGHLSRAHLRRFLKRTVPQKKGPLIQKKVHPRRRAHQRECLQASHLTSPCRAPRERGIPLRSHPGLVSVKMQICSANLITLSAASHCVAVRLDLWVTDRWWVATRAWTLHCTYGTSFGVFFVLVFFVPLKP